MNDAKYIGLDVHQATISVAVLDSSGNLVMEAILETKAETILQFIHGLRGSLHVTLEEGTWAAWLHDLLQPHVSASAGLRSAQECPVESREQERPHRCAQAGRTVVPEQAQPGVSRRTGHPHSEGIGPQLPGDHSRSDAGDESTESHLPKLGDSLCRQAGVCTALPCGMACEDLGSRRTPSCRTLLPAVRRLSGVAPAKCGENYWRKAGNIWT